MISNRLRSLARLLTRVVPGLNSIHVYTVSFSGDVYCSSDLLWDYIAFSFNETTSKDARCRCHPFFFFCIFLFS